MDPRPAKRPRIQPNVSAVDDSENSDNDGPVELPNGRLICRPHRLVVCGFCCVDYSFMEELLEGSNDDSESESGSDSELELEPKLKPEVFTDYSVMAVPTHRAQVSASRLGIASGVSTIERGKGRVFASKFIPPSATSTPAELFPACRSAGHLNHSFIRPDDHKQILIYTDGACLNNGKANPKAGWAFVHKRGPDQTKGSISSRLEKEGPFGDACSQTSNRAELRAVLAALRFRFWPGEGFTTVVIASDSEYVAEGATTWARRWIANDWKNGKGATTKNRDLWEAILGEIERYDAHGTKIKFWRIPRRLNETADKAAKIAAERESADDVYFDFLGIISRY